MLEFNNLFKERLRAHSPILASLEKLRLRRNNIMNVIVVTRMNPGGRFAPQSQLSETAKDGALLRGFGGAALDLGRGSGECMTLWSRSIFGD